MNVSEVIPEIVATYSRHGWTVRRVLLRPEARAMLASETNELLHGADIRESEFDAIWFARASHAKREAWELRLIAEQPFALFEAFEAEEPEEDREEVRREMENRMREQTTRS